MLELGTAAPALAEPELRRCNGEPCGTVSGGAFGRAALVAAVCHMSSVRCRPGSRWRGIEDRAAAWVGLMVLCRSAENRPARHYRYLAGHIWVDLRRGWLARVNFPSLYHRSGPIACDAYPTIDLCSPRSKLDTGLHRPSLFLYTADFPDTVNC